MSSTPPAAGMEEETAANNVENGYRPPPEFQEEAKESLVDLTLTDSREFWLIQYPTHLTSDFDGQKVSLNLHVEDGQLGSFEGSSGKTYELLSCSSREPDFTVFESSSTGSKVAGKISRRVSIVSYLDSNELEEILPTTRKIYPKSSGISSLTKSSRHYPTASQTTEPTPHSGSRNTASTHSSRHRSGLSEAGEPPKLSKRGRELFELSGTLDGSAQNSGPSHSGLTSRTSSEQSSKAKSKRRAKSQK